MYPVVCANAQASPLRMFHVGSGFTGFACSRQGRVCIGFHDCARLYENDVKVREIQMQHMRVSAVAFSPSEQLFLICHDPMYTQASVVICELDGRVVRTIELRRRDCFMLAANDSHIAVGFKNSVSATVLLLDYGGQRCYEWESFAVCDLAMTAKELFVAIEYTKTLPAKLDVSDRVLTMPQRCADSGLRCSQTRPTAVAHHTSAAPRLNHARNPQPHMHAHHAGPRGQHIRVHRQRSRSVFTRGQVSDLVFQRRARPCCPRWLCVHHFVGAYRIAARSVYRSHGQGPCAAQHPPCQCVRIR